MCSWPSAHNGHLSIIHSACSLAAFFWLGLLKYNIWRYFNVNLFFKKNFKIYSARINLKYASFSLKFLKNIFKLIMTFLINWKITIKTLNYLMFYCQNPPNKISIIRKPPKINLTFALSFCRHASSYSSPGASLLSSSS